MDMDGKRTITVMDDNPDIVTIVETILEGKGYEVVCASSGQELFKRKPRPLLGTLHIDSKITCRGEAETLIPLQ